MKEALFSLFENTNTLTMREIIINLSMAAVIGFVIYISYWLSHTGTVYSRKFNVSLLMLTVLTATVMLVIGNNIALSLGMVGALSIVRYRTAIKDSRDTAYIFWCIIAGICCGAGDYTVGVLGSLFVFAILFIFGRIKNDNRLLLIIRCPRTLEKDVDKIVDSSFERKSVLKVKNTTKDSIEFIYEISRKRYEKIQQTSENLLDRLYALGDIEYINVVAQNDDISS